MFPRKGQKKHRQGAKALCLVLVLCLGLAGCRDAPPSSPTQEAAFLFGEEYPDFPEGRPVAAIYLQSSGVGAFRRGREALFPADAAELLDLIYVAFARFDGDEIKMPAVPEEVYALREKGVSVLISFSANAADSSARLGEIASSPELTAAFAHDLTEKVKALGLDGVDLDWEAVSATVKPTAAGMNALAKALRKAGGDSFLLTCAVPSSSWGLAEDRFDFQTLSGLMDYFNLMSYDLGKQDRATHHAPLYPSDSDGGWGLGAVTGASILVRRGVKPGQILLGCAAYGTAYQTTGEEASPGDEARPVRLPLSGAYEGGTVQGEALRELLSDPAWVKKTEWRDGAFVASYLTKGNLFVTYDSEEAFTEKLSFARRTGCGLMLWSYTQDSSGRFLSVLRRERAAWDDLSE